MFLRTVVPGKTYGSELIEETTHLSGGLESVLRLVQRRPHPQCTFAKSPAPSESVPALRGGHWPRRFEQTARARHGPLFPVRQSVGDVTHSSRNLASRENLPYL